MLLREETTQLENSDLKIVYELENLIASLNGNEKEIAEKALREIERLDEELKREKSRIKELTVYFSTWIEGLGTIIKTPLYLEDSEQVQVRYSALRNSTINMVDSCRKKISDIEAGSERK